MKLNKLYIDVFSDTMEAAGFSFLGALLEFAFRLANRPRDFGNLRGAEEDGDDQHDD